MNSPQATPTRDPAAALLAALARAKAEKLVAYPNPDGTWSCRDHTIRVTGPRAQDVACDCADATYRHRVCKHAVCVVFARKHHVRPVRPVTPVPAAPVRSCRGCGRSPVTDGLLYCGDCARPERARTTADLVAAHGAAYFRPLRRA